MLPFLVIPIDIRIMVDKIINLKTAADNLYF